MQEENPQYIILRVPILYGNVESISESAVNVLLRTAQVHMEITITDLQNTSQKHSLDNWAIRYPTNGSFALTKFQ